VEVHRTVADRRVEVIQHVRADRNVSNHAVVDETAFERIQVAGPTQHHVGGLDPSSEPGIPQPQRAR
jgi:hypothetical protein